MKQSARSMNLPFDGVHVKEGLAPEVSRTAADHYMLLPGGPGVGVGVILVDEVLTTSVRKMTKKK